MGVSRLVREQEVMMSRSGSALCEQVVLLRGGALSKQVLLCGGLRVLLEQQRGVGLRRLRWRRRLWRLRGSEPARGGQRKDQDSAEHRRPAEGKSSG